MHQALELRRPQDNRYYSLDFWRGLACLMVVAFHSSFYVLFDARLELHGFLAFAYGLIWQLQAGVPIFFVISGYCIAAACDNLRQRSGGFVRYFHRRFRRIFPPFWGALLATVALAVVLNRCGLTWLYSDSPGPILNPSSQSVKWWLVNLSLVGTWTPNLFHSRPWPDILMLAHSWTLCYEEQFYAICGIALFASRTYFFRILFVLTAFVAGLMPFQMRYHFPINGFFFDGRWLTFAAGVAVYFRLHRAAQSTRWWIDIALIITFAISAVANLTEPTPKARELCIGCVFAVIILSLHRFDLAMRSNRVLAPVAACGTMCYSLYLVHWPVVKPLSHALYIWGIQSPDATILVTLPICMAVSLVCGWIFFRVVERRFLNAPSTVRSGPVIPVAGEEVPTEKPMIQA